MKQSLGQWTVIHDPLKLVSVKSGFADVEVAASDQGEDIIQLECVSPTQVKKIIDLGWYNDRFVVVLVEGGWAAPIRKIESRDLQSAMEAFHSLTL